MRFLVAAASLGLLLPGCSSPPDNAADSTPTGVFTSTATASDLPPAGPTTDTLHFLEAPHMAGQLPPGDEVVRQAVPSYLQEYGLADRRLEWTFPRPDLLTLSGEARLWVDVQGTVANAGYIQLAGCFWILWISVYADSEYQAGRGVCIMEPPVLATGVRDIRIQMPVFDQTNVVGDLIVLGLQTAAAPSSTGTVTLLAGTAEYDSTVRIDGLQLPLDTQTYL